MRSFGQSISRLLPRFARIIRRRRFGQNEAGVTAVEFALIAPPFFALLMGVFEVGLIFFSSSILENAVAESARLVRTGQAQNGHFTKANFKKSVCDNLTMFDCSKLVIDVETFKNFGSVNLSPPLDNNGKLKKGFPFSMGNGSDVVLVRVFYEWGLMAPGLSLMQNMGTGNRLLSAVQVFRNEPF
ncbi:MAG TPA: pilus assembly protein [Rhizobiales bacterium]|nr:pilus assembly protein [Hyphomicrobiales bacterium]